MACRPFLAALCLGFFCAATWAATPKEDQPAPPFAAKVLDGRSLDGSSLAGKVVLLHFWATWCPPCREELPALDAFYRAHRADGLEVLTVSVDDPAEAAKVRAFAAAYAFPTALAGDAQMGGYGRIWTLPLSFLIDRRGVLRKADWTGGEKLTAESLERRVLPLLREP